MEDIPADQWPLQGPHYVVSSASIPGLFIPQEIDGGVFIDGGTAMGVDAISAVESCLTVVDDQTKITLDIILLDRFTAPDPESDDGDTIKNLIRLYEVKSYFKGLQNVIVTMLAYPNVNYRYILEPSGHYAHLWNLLNFSPENTWPMQQNGMADAKAAMEAGPGANFQKYRDWAERRGGDN